jgi:hypothetical protein
MAVASSRWVVLSLGPMLPSSYESAAFIGSGGERALSHIRSTTTRSRVRQSQSRGTAQCDSNLCIAHTHAGDLRTLWNQKAPIPVNKHYIATCLHLLKSMSDAPHS